MKMKTTTHSIQTGTFKAKCLILIQVKNPTTITITTHGKAVEKQEAIEKNSKNFFGCLKNKISINADITKPY